MTQVLAYNATTTSATYEYSTLRRDTEMVDAVTVGETHVPEPEFEYVTFEVQRLLGGRLSLNVPIPVLLSRGPVDTTVTSRILGVHGIGEDPRAAFEDWCAEIEYEYYYLAENADRLGPSLRRRWDVFQEYLQPTLFG